MIYRDIWYACISLYLPIYPYLSLYILNVLLDLFHQPEHHINCLREWTVCVELLVFKFDVCFICLLMIDFTYMSAFIYFAVCYIYAYLCSLTSLTCQRSCSFTLLVVLYAYLWAHFTYMSTLIYFMYSEALILGTPSFSVKVCVP